MEGGSDVEVINEQTTEEFIGTRIVRCYKICARGFASQFGLGKGLEGTVDLLVAKQALLYPTNGAASVLKTDPGRECRILRTGKDFAGGVHFDCGVEGNS